MKAAAAGALMVVLPHEASAATVDGKILTGTIDLIQAGAVLVKSAAGTATIRFADNAAFYRDGPAQLSDFRVGDRVVVALTTTSTTEQADLLENLYFRIDGTVVRINASEIVTSEGSAALDGLTVVHKFNDRASLLSLSDLRIGSAVAILRRYDPVASAYIARRIGVKV